jgi:hypothetical protein
MSKLAGRGYRLAGRTITGDERRAHWFATPGRCSRCSKSADGVLMSVTNERLGAYCTGCARAVLAAVTLTVDTSEGAT